MDKMRKCKLSTMSDEEIEAYMMSVDEQLNDDGFDSDDDISDPDFQPDDFIEESTEESTDRAILECLDEMEEANTSSAFLNALDLSVSSRGYSVEYVGAAYGVDISTVTWKDNRAVRLASTYVGVMPFLKTNPTAVSTKLPRYDRKKKSYIEVDCPQIIKEYNTHMGGVDLMDGLMGRYHIRLKTRNPMNRIFYHFLDMAVTNAYILYHRVNPSDKINLPDFREKIACGLCSFSLPKKVGRPSTTSCQPTTSQGKRCVRPIDHIRFDNTGHIPAMFNKSGKRRCKYCKQSDTQIYCSKCEINLCLTPNKNCFKEFHSK